MIIWLHRILESPFVQLYSVVFNARNLYGIPTYLCDCSRMLPMSIVHRIWCVYTRIYTVRSLPRQTVDNRSFCSTNKTKFWALCRLGRLRTIFNKTLSSVWYIGYYPLLKTIVKHKTCTRIQYQWRSQTFSIGWIKKKKILSIKRELLDAL